MASNPAQDATAGRPSPAMGGSKDRFWIPRFWDGMGMAAWFGLLARNRFTVGPLCIAMAVIISALTVVNELMWVLQEVFYGRTIRRTEVEHHPIFIIGHWRSGTTLLHELLVLDDRHTYPDTYACFAPKHFLLTSRVIPWLLHFLLPSRRPMDNMAVGWNRPQEDEFALCNLGARSPYLTITFPNNPPQDQKYLDLRGLSTEELARWKRTFALFLKCLTVREPKRIVLKSPPHTCRIKRLLELYPDARFVHIVRDPYVLFPSTINLWKRLYRDQGLQTPRYEGLEEHVFETFCRMYEVFEQERESIAPSRLCEVRYEELIEDPMRQMRRIYEQLELGGFDAVQPALEKHLAAVAGSKTNRYEISPQTHAEITRRWSAFIHKYGYSTELDSGQ